MTKAKLRKLLTKPKFRAWLEAKKPRAVVGLAHINADCPIARYMGHSFAEIDGADWVEDFASTLDYKHIYRQPITASRALRILDGIK